MALESMKRQAAEGENIFVSHISNKKLLLNTKNPRFVLKKIQSGCGQKTGRHFTEEDIQMSKKHMKRHLTSLAIRTC